MIRFLLAATCAAALCACNSGGGEQDGAEATNAGSQQAELRADTMSSNDAGAGQPAASAAAPADGQAQAVMQAQVVLDRLGFSAGVIDGVLREPTRNAIRGFQKANALRESGELDEATMAALGKWSSIAAIRSVTIPADFAAGPFAPLPEHASQQAKLPALGYASLEEKLAERFHTTVEVLRQLNGVAQPTPAAAPSATPQPASATPAPAPVPFAAGQQIRVPNVGADQIDGASVENKDWLRTLIMLGVGTAQPKVDRIVVSKSKGTLEAYEGEKLVALFNVTTGSRHDPLPLGDWKINGTSYNPKFHYNPDLFWDVPDSKDAELLPPGPNSPVGVVWIDLSKEHYGIHGTPEPASIGQAESHGCVRLTNWDAARLARMVSGSTAVKFVA